MDLQAMRLAPEPATVQYQAENDRIEALEQRVEEMQEQITQLRETLKDFMRQFE